MPACYQYGIDYNRAFQVIKKDRTWAFDSFECTIQAVAPSCPHCGVRIVGHGVEEGGHVFCCVHRARHEGRTSLKDWA